jgi:hypothetical protein
MKSPPIQYTDDEARRMLEEFIAGKSSETLPSRKPTAKQVRSPKK